MQGTMYSSGDFYETVVSYHKKNNFFQTLHLYDVSQNTE